MKLLHCIPLVPELCTVALVLGSATSRAAELTGPEVLERYLAALQAREATPEHATMTVAIEARAFKRGTSANLTATRDVKGSEVHYRDGHGFTGDRSLLSHVISPVINRDSSDGAAQKVVPTFYRMRFLGLRTLEEGGSAYLFEVVPTKKQKKLVGAYKGELWLEPRTFLPVIKRGTFTKSPSFMIKKVTFENRFAVNDGVWIPLRYRFEANSRGLGSGELTITYSDYRPVPSTAPEAPAP